MTRPASGHAFCGACSGAGLGLRRGMLDDLSGGIPTGIDFFEIAPENWVDVGGRWGRQFREIVAQRPVMAHGLSLNIGGQAPLDMAFLARLRDFFTEFEVQSYSEHLSYCGDEGHLYDLLPIPFTDEAVRHVAARIRTVQEVLERPLILENVSYYCAPGRALSEAAFVAAVLDEADCALLLDVNNVYVNSVNHGDNALAFIDAMPADRVAYLHVAGHHQEAEDLIIDTHGADIVDPVWDLLEAVFARFGAVPTLLERDFNLPGLPALVASLDRIRALQANTPPDHVAV